MKRILTLVLFLSLFATVSAQDGATLHFMRMNPYSTNYNPSTFIPYKWYVGMIGVGNVNAAFSNTGFHYNTLFGKNAGSPITTIYLNDFVNHLARKGNILNTNVALSLIDFGFTTKKIRFAFSYKVRVDENFLYNQDLFAFPVYGNMHFAGEENAAHPDLAVRAGKLWKIANKYGLYQGDNKRNIVFDGNGDAYMCGYFNGNIDFMGRQLTSSGSDIFIAKITADNELGFLYRIGSKADDVAYNIVLGDDNSFYFSGLFNGELTVAGQTLKTQQSDMFIAKCSRNGQLAWISQANIGQMDSINNTFAAQFDPNGKRLWTRTYAENEDFSDYGIRIDKDGSPFLAGSMLASAGLMSKSYESMARRSGFVVNGRDMGEVAETPTDPSIAGLLNLVAQVSAGSKSLSGKQMQKDLSSSNPSFSTKSPEMFAQFGNIELIRNGQGIVTVRTNDGNPAVFNTVRLDNNSKLKISVYNSGNALIEFLSGSQYGNEQAWLPLNSLKVYRTSGNMTFDYDLDHTHRTVNAKQIF